MTTTQTLINAAIKNSIGKVSLTADHADEVYDTLKPFLVPGTRCSFIHQGFALWLDEDVSGEQFLCARPTPLICNNSSLTNAQVISLVKEHDDFFNSAGLTASGETPYKLIDGKLVQTGSTHNAEIVVFH